MKDIDGGKLTRGNGMQAGRDNLYFTCILQSGAVLGGITNQLTSSSELVGQVKSRIRCEEAHRPSRFYGCIESQISFEEELGILEKGIR